MEILAIIPARGGSKGIPRKNLSMINGIPLITRTVRAARKSSLVKRVVVSTDDREIAEVAESSGGEVIWRSPELSDDLASSESALVDVLMKLQASGYTPEIVVFLQCTSPFTNADDIDGTIKELFSRNADCALAVTEFEGNVWKLDADRNNFQGVNHDISKGRLRRQDKAVEYLETGSVYVMRTDSFLKHKNRFFGKIAPYTIPKLRAIEIDDSVDLMLAECVAEKANP